MFVLRRERGYWGGFVILVVVFFALGEVGRLGGVRR